jgi:hypothetical protein
MHNLAQTSCRRVRTVPSDLLNLCDVTCPNSPLRLEDVSWLEYEDEWDIDIQVQRTKTLYTAKDVRKKLGMMQKCVKRL